MIHCWTTPRELQGDTPNPDCPHGGHDDIESADECAWGTTHETCLLADGHAGPHEFTPDDEIFLTFAPVGGQP